MTIRTVVVRKTTNEKPRRLLEPEEFCKMLLSRRRLVPCDKIGTDACRLLYETSGELFDVGVATLDKYVETEERLEYRA